MMHTLPWQNIITALIIMAAMAYLARRWWPGSKAKAACHDSGAGPAPASQGSCGSGCSGCATPPAKGSDQAPIVIHRHPAR